MIGSKLVVPDQCENWYSAEDTRRRSVSAPSKDMTKKIFPYIKQVVTRTHVNTAMLLRSILRTTNVFFNTELVTHQKLWPKNSFPHMKHVSNENTSYYCDAACAQFWGFRSEYKKKKTYLWSTCKISQCWPFFYYYYYLYFQEGSYGRSLDLRMVESVNFSDRNEKKKRPGLKVFCCMNNTVPKFHVQMRKSWAQHR